MSRLTLIALLALSAACLELEGRPCAGSADCIDGYTCRVSVCLRAAGAPELGDGGLSASAGDLVIDQPLGALEVHDHDEDELAASLIGEGALVLDDGRLEARGAGPATVVVALPRRFDLEVIRADSVRVDERDGALLIGADGDLVVAHSVASDVALETRDGDIRLTVPSGADFFLDAEAEEVRFEGVELTTGVNLFGTAAGVVGAITATRRVDLRAPGGTITLIGR